MRRAPQPLRLGRPRELERVSAFEGRIFGVVRCRLRFQDGSESRQDLVTHGGAAVIAPLLDPETILLVRQYRHAAGDSLWEVPAGRLERGERPLTAAKRELAEECGLEARTWRKVPPFYPAPGYTNERMHLFFATGLRPARGEATPDRDEEFVLRPFTRRELERAVERGSVCDGKTIAALAHWARRTGRRR